MSFPPAAAGKFQRESRSLEIMMIRHINGFPEFTRRGGIESGNDKTVCRGITEWCAWYDANHERYITVPPKLIRYG